MDGELGGEAGSGRGTPEEGTRGEGRDGTVEAYREVLREPWWLWVVVLLFLASLAIAVAYPLGRLAGVITMLGGTAITAAVFFTSRAPVRVDDLVLRAGAARLPLRVVGRVRVLDRSETVSARGSGADTRAYFCQRPWLPVAVVVEVDDPQDPHPYWLVSTKHPTELARALVRGRLAARGDVTRTDLQGSGPQRERDAEQHDAEQDGA